MKKGKEGSGDLSKEEVRKQQGEDKSIEEADGVYTPELGEELSSKAGRISEIVRGASK